MHGADCHCLLCGQGTGGAGDFAGSGADRSEREYCKKCEKCDCAQHGRVKGDRCFSCGRNCGRTTGKGAGGYCRGNIGTKTADERVFGPSSHKDTTSGYGRTAGYFSDPACRKGTGQCANQRIPYKYCAGNKEWGDALRSWCSGCYGGEADRSEPFKG